MRRKNLDLATLELVANTFKILAVPVRLLILQQLQNGEKSVSQLCGDIATSQPNISKHLKILYGASLVDKRQVGNSVYYEITDPLVHKLCDLVCSGIQKQLNRKIRVFSTLSKSQPKKSKTGRRVS